MNIRLPTLALLIMAQLFSACKPKEPVQLAPASGSASIALSKAQASAYHVEVSQEKDHLSISIVDRAGARKELAQATIEPDVDDTGSHWIEVKKFLGEVETEIYFVSKDNGSVLGPFEAVYAFDRIHDIVALPSETGLIIRKLGPDSAAFINLQAPTGLGAALSPRNVLLDLNRFSFCNYNDEGQPDCVTLPFQFDSLSSFVCAVKTVGGVCPALTADLDGDKLPDSIQLVSINHSIAGRPAKVLENPWGKTLFRFPEDLAVRVKLSGDRAREFLLYDSSYFHTPGWENVDERMKNLAVHPRSDVPFPEAEYGADGKAKPKGDMVSFPTEAGTDIFLYFDGAALGVHYPADEP